MAVVNIPTEYQTKKDLVAVPKQAYEEFVAWQKNIKNVTTFVATKRDRAALARARRNIANGAFKELKDVTI